MTLSQLMKFTLCSLPLFPSAPTVAAAAQRMPSSSATRQQAFDTMAAVVHLFFESDSLATMSWPSPKTPQIDSRGRTVRELVAEGVRLVLAGESTQRPDNVSTRKPQWLGELRQFSPMRAALMTWNP